MPSGHPPRSRNFLTTILLIALLGGCSHTSFYDEGLDAMASGNKAQGLASLEQATRDDPRNAEKRAAFIRHRDETVGTYLVEAESLLAAGQSDAAGAAYQRVLMIDSRNARAQMGLERIVTERRNTAQLALAEQLLSKGDLSSAERTVRTVRAQDPKNTKAARLQQQIDDQRAKELNPAANPAVKAALAKPVALEFRDATLKSVFEVLSRSSGLNFVFDKDVKGDTKITFFVRNSPLEDILQLILTTNQLGKRQLNDNSFLIYPNTAPKAKEYQELVVRSFYLVNTDVKQAQAVVKNIAKSKDVFADEKLNLLIVKDTPDAIALIERLIESIDLSEPEVMLEVEVLEVTRSRIQSLGIDWPTFVGYGQLLPSSTTTTTTAAGYTTTVVPGGTLAPGFIDTSNTSALTTFVANPAFKANINAQNGDTNLLANPRIRVKNREKAKIHIGERLPVFTTTSTANVGVSASVSYLDIGLKLDVETNITLDDDVSMKVGLEVSNVVKEVTGPQESLAYQVGTRSTATTLRLKDGETQVLAGLISDEERKATSHVPGLGDIPAFGRLFGTQRDTNIKTEIILLITPRVIRNIHRPELAQPAWPSGTESAIGASPLRVKPTPSKALAMSTRGTGGATQATREAAEAVQATAEAKENAEEPAKEPNANDAPAAGIKISGPNEAASGSDIDLSISLPPQDGAVRIDITYDPTLFEAVQPAASSSGRVTLSAAGGQASLRLRALPGAKGESNITITSATVENGGAQLEAGASHTVRLN